MDKKTNFDIIIPIVYKDYSFLSKSLIYILSNIDGARKILFITKKSMQKYLPSQVFSSDRFLVVDEDDVLEGLTYSKISSIIHSQKREHTNIGWYFQQFLKMAFALSKYCETSYYLSWDADTIPIHNIPMFSPDGHPFFTMKTEYHEPYFITIRKLLNLEKCNERSYISEHMLFNKNIMNEIVSKIEDSNVIGDTWYEKVLNSLVPESVSTHAFSEFETYGTYCKTFYPDYYVERQLSSFRHGGLIQGRFFSKRILNSLATDVSIVSFEIYDRPPFPWNIICEWYEKLLKKKELFLLKRVNEKSEL